MVNLVCSGALRAVAIAQYLAKAKPEAVGACYSVVNSNGDMPWHLEDARSACQRLP
jgi:hypothetical protein